MLNREEMNRAENVAHKELIAAIKGLSVLNQTKTGAVIYRGVKLEVKQGCTEVIILTEGGRPWKAGEYQDYRRAQRVAEEIMQRYHMNDDIYPMPAE